MWGLMNGRVQSRATRRRLSSNSNAIRFSCANVDFLAWRGNSRLVRCYRMPQCRKLVSTYRAPPHGSPDHMEHLLRRDKLSYCQGKYLTTKQKWLLVVRT